MQSSNKNPFELFGVTPELASRLNEKDLFSVIKSLYRTLLKVHHPDRCRSKSSKAAEKHAAMAVDLNLAFEKLNLEKDPESFKKYQKRYSSRRTRGLKKRIIELEQEIIENRTRQTSLADGYMNFLLKGLPWITGNGQESHRLSPPLANLKLGLNDVAINQNLRSVSWNMGSNYKEIIFDSLGTMYYRPVGRSKAFQANYIYLLGCIDMDKIDLLPILDRVPPREGFFKSPALDSRYGIDGAPLQVLNTITLEKFKNYCLSALSSTLTERSYLFSVHRPQFEANSGITLEGVIVKLSNL